MLGLRDLDGVRPRRPAVAQTAADGATALGSGLAGYLGAVARALGVSAGDASFEVSDTATAHLALARKSARGPDRDLMLLWSEQRGWSVSIAARPADPAVLARLGGDLVPAPHMVASFVRAVLAGHGAPTVRTIVPMPRDRHELAARMRAHVAD
ncbi:hypothetical protein BAY59_20300 [Prauserella coralliicola]|nr:hypothetical protein BAY59_20300 [Prauserella coralliicola]